MFFIKLYFGNQWDSEDIYTVIGFGFTDFFMIKNPRNEKTPTKTDKFSVKITKR